MLMFIYEYYDALSSRRHNFLLRFLLKELGYTCIVRKLKHPILARIVGIVKYSVITAKHYSGGTRL